MATLAFLCGLTVLVGANIAARMALAAGKLPQMPATLHHDI